LKIVLYFFPGAQNAYNREWVHYHYEPELRDAGHEVITINPLDRGTGLSRADYDDFVVSTVAREHERGPVSLFFAQVRDADMSPSAVERIREHGIPTATLGGDDTLVPHLSRSIASAFDLYWVGDPEGVENITRYGGRVLSQPVAANPRIFEPQAVPEDVDVGFCGQRYGSRIYYVNEMARRGIPVDVYGVGWKSGGGPGDTSGGRKRLSLVPAIRHVAASLTHRPGRTWARAAVLHRLRRKRIDSKIQALIDKHAHPPLSFPELVRFYSRCKLTLGFNEYGQTHLVSNPLVSVRTRDFEALSAGACYMMYRFPAALECFDEDKEVLFYSSAEELGDKTRFYLDPRRDSVRVEIRRRARARILSEHTWTHRFDRLFKELGINTR